MARVRLVHTGGAGFRVEHPGGRLHLDPPEPPEDPRDLLVLTGFSPSGLEAVARAVEARRHQRVVADRATLDWLDLLGDVEGHLPPVQVDGFSFDDAPLSAPTRPPPGDTLLAALRRPRTLLHALRTARHRPPMAGRALRIDLPDAGRMVAVPRLDPAEGEDLEGLLRRWSPIRWLVACPLPGREAEAADLLARSGAALVVLADLRSAERARLGLPSPLLTPAGDRLRAAGQPAVLLPRGAVLRFDAPPAADAGIGGAGS